MEQYISCSCPVVGRTQDKKEEYIAPLRSASGGELWKEVICLSFSKLTQFGLFWFTLLLEARVESDRERLERQSVQGVVIPYCASSGCHRRFFSVLEFALKLLVVSQYLYT
jgi:hypothetical protein